MYNFGAFNEMLKQSCGFEDVDQWVERFPNAHETLRSIPRAT